MTAASGQCEAGRAGARNFRAAGGGRRGRVQPVFEGGRSACTVRELLYGLMLALGKRRGGGARDCNWREAWKHLSGADERESAGSWGLTQYAFCKTRTDSTARCTTRRRSDLAKLSVCAMQNETFRAVVSSKSFTENGRSFTNHNKLLWRVDGADGIKTGYTKKSGQNPCRKRSARRKTARLRDDLRPRRLARPAGAV